MSIQLFAAAAFLVAVAPAVAAESDDGPPWNVTGDNWMCVKNCMNGVGRPTRVIQNGKQFRFINEYGGIGYGEWVYDFLVEFVGCDNSAVVSADGNTITFGFGAVWVR